MKIFGIGTDIVKVSRVKNLIRNKLFQSRIFNKEEIEAILLPSIYTSDLSIQLAEQQCKNLNIYRQLNLQT